MEEFNRPPANNDSRSNEPDPARKIVKAKTPFRWLRRFILLLGLASVAGFVLVFVAYNFGKGGDDASSPELSAANTDSDAVTSGRNVDYVQTSGGRQVFRVRAAKSVQDKEETSFLEDAIFDFFREGGTSYRIESQKARLNQKTGEALLEGDVKVTGFGDLELKARSLSLLQSGQILESQGMVEFKHKNPDLVGRASRLTIDRAREQVDMDGGVHIRSTGNAPTELRLDSEKLVYSKSESLVRATEKVFLRYGSQELRADALSLFLKDDQRSLRNLRARYNVEGQIDSLDNKGGALKAIFRAAFLEIEPDEHVPESSTLRLDGEGGRPALLKQSLEDGLVRSIQGNHLEALVKESKVSEVRGDGVPVRIDEYIDVARPVYLRRACATQLRAYMGADGTFSHLLLDGQVDLQEERIQLSGGNQAKVDGVQGTIEITGSPVEVNAEQGELAAPTIRYSRKTGILRALSGVRAGLKSVEGAFGGALGGGSEADGMVSIEAEEATLTSAPRTFVFKGQARAWQGDNFLFADQIRGDGTKQELAAGGQVKTIWLPPKKDETAPVPIVVNADTLSYRRAESQLIYQGNARLDQQGRFLRCNELTLQLTKMTPTQVEKLLCKDQVVLDDTVDGQRVTGDFAVYDPISATVEITGQEVHLLDRQKNELVGKYLTYDFRSGKATLRSQAPSGGGQQP
jgi:LPS export ABC transporter protein LptC